MKSILLNRDKSAKNAQEYVSMIPVNTKLADKGTTCLIVTNFGAVSTSSVTNGHVGKTVILHTDDTHSNGIDIERRLTERTAIMDNDVTFLNIDSLVNKFVPESSIHFSKEIAGSDKQFFVTLKNYAGGTQLEYVTSLKFSTLAFDELKQKLTSFTQNISKMSFFIEKNNQLASNLGDYLKMLRDLTDRPFDTFTSSNFQQLISVSKHASSLAFDKARDFVEFSGDHRVQQIIDDMRLIKNKVDERSAYNLKGLKMYITKDTITANLLGQTFPKVSTDGSIMTHLLSHVVMCGQLEDLKTKLERTKLLHA